MNNFNQKNIVYNLTKNNTLPFSKNTDCGFNANQLIYSSVNSNLKKVVHNDLFIERQLKIENESLYTGPRPNELSGEIDETVPDGKKYFSEFIYKQDALNTELSIFKKEYYDISDNLTKIDVEFGPDNNDAKKKFFSIMSNNYVLTQDGKIYYISFYNNTYTLTKVKFYSEETNNVLTELEDIVINNFYSPNSEILANKFYICSKTGLYLIKLNSVSSTNTKNNVTEFIVDKIDTGDITDILDMFVFRNKYFGNKLYIGIQYKLNEKNHIRIFKLNETNYDLIDLNSFTDKEFKNIHKIIQLNDDFNSVIINVNDNNSDTLYTYNSLYGFYSPETNETLSNITKVITRRYTQIDGTGNIEDCQKNIVIAGSKFYLLNKDDDQRIILEDVLFNEETNINDVFVYNEVDSNDNNIVYYLVSTDSGLFAVYYDDNSKRYEQFQLIQNKAVISSIVEDKSIYAFIVENGKLIVYSCVFDSIENATNNSFITVTDYGTVLYSELIESEFLNYWLKVSDTNISIDYTSFFNLLYIDSSIFLVFDKSIYTLTINNEDRTRQFNLIDNSDSNDNNYDSYYSDSNIIIYAFNNGSNNVKLKYSIINDELSFKDIYLTNTENITKVFSINYIDTKITLTNSYFRGYVLNTDNGIILCSIDNGNLEYKKTYLVGEKICSTLYIEENNNIELIKILYFIVRNSDGKNYLYSSFNNNFELNNFDDLQNKSNYFNLITEIKNTNENIDRIGSNINNSLYVLNNDSSDNVKRAYFYSELICNLSAHMLNIIDNPSTNISAYKEISSINRIYTPSNNLTYFVTNGGLYKFNSIYQGEELSGTVYPYLKELSDVNCICDRTLLNNAQPLMSNGNTLCVFSFIDFPIGSTKNYNSTKLAFNLFESTTSTEGEVEKDGVSAITLNGDILGIDYFTQNDDYVTQQYSIAGDYTYVVTTNNIYCQTPTYINDYYINYNLDMVSVYNSTGGRQSININNSLSSIELIAYYENNFGETLEKYYTFSYYNGVSSTIFSYVDSNNVSVVYNSDLTTTLTTLYIGGPSALMVDRTANETPYYNIKEIVKRDSLSSGIVLNSVYAFVKANQSDYLSNEIVVSQLPILLSCKSTYETLNYKNIELSAINTGGGNLSTFTNITKTSIPNKNAIIARDNVLYTVNIQNIEKTTENPVISGYNYYTIEFSNTKELDNLSAVYTQNILDIIEYNDFIYLKVITNYNNSLIHRIERIPKNNLTGANRTVQSELVTYTDSNLNINQLTLTTPINNTYLKYSLKTFDIRKIRTTLDTSENISDKLIINGISNIICVSGETSLSLFDNLTDFYIVDFANDIYKVILCGYSNEGLTGAVSCKYFEYNETNDGYVYNIDKQSTLNHYLNGCDNLTGIKIFSHTVPMYKDETLEKNITLNIFSNNIKSSIIFSNEFIDSSSYINNIQNIQISYGTTKNTLQKTKFTATVKYKNVFFVAVKGIYRDSTTKNFISFFTKDDFISGNTLNLHYTGITFESDEEITDMVVNIQNGNTLYIKTTKTVYSYDFANLLSFDLETIVDGLESTDSLYLEKYTFDGNTDLINNFSSYKLLTFNNDFLLNYGFKTKITNSNMLFLYGPSSNVYSINENELYYQKLIDTNIADNKTIVEFIQLDSSNIVYSKSTDAKYLCYDNVSGKFKECDSNLTYNGTRVVFNPNTFNIKYLYNRLYLLPVDSTKDIFYYVESQIINSSSKLYTLDNVYEKRTLSNNKQAFTLVTPEIIKEKYNIDDISIYDGYYYYGNDKSYHITKTDIYDYKINHSSLDKRFDIDIGSTDSIKSIEIDSFDNNNIIINTANNISYYYNISLDSLTRTDYSYFTNIFFNDINGTLFVKDNSLFITTKISETDEQTTEINNTRIINFGDIQNILVTDDILYIFETNNIIAEKFLTTVTTIDKQKYSYSGQNGLIIKDYLYNNKNYLAIKNRLFTITSNHDNVAIVDIGECTEIDEIEKLINTQYTSPKNLYNDAFVVLGGNGVYVFDVSERTFIRDVNFNKVIFIYDSFYSNYYTRIVYCDDGIYSTKYDFKLILDRTTENTNIDPYIVDIYNDVLDEKHIENDHSENSVITKINNSLDVSFSIDLLESNFTVKNDNLITNDLVKNITIFDGLSKRKINAQYKSYITNNEYKDLNDITYIIKDYYSGISEIYIHLGTTNTYYVNVNTNNYGDNKFIVGKSEYVNNINSKNIYGEPFNSQTNVKLMLDDTLVKNKKIVLVEINGNSLPLNIVKDNSAENGELKNKFNTYILPSYLCFDPISGNILVKENESDSYCCIDFGIFGTDEQSIKIVLREI